MVEQSSVVVTGADEPSVAETATALRQALDSTTVTTAMQGVESADVYCLVADATEESVLDRIRAEHPDVPVILFADADPSALETVLQRPGIDYVQRGGDEQYVVLAHRVEAALAERTVGDERTNTMAAGGDGGKRSPAAIAETVDELGDAVYTLDADGRIAYLNAALADLTGYDESELLGEDAAVLTGDDPVGLGGAELLERDGGDEAMVTVLDLEPRRGEPITCEDHARLVTDDDGTVCGAAGVLREATDQQRRRETITQLQEISRDLMQAPSRESVAQVVINAVETVLGYDMNVVRLYDAEAQVLEPVATSDAVADRLDDRPTYSLDEGQPGRVFASGEPAVHADVRAVSDDRDLGPVRAAMYLPVGVHGTLSVGAPTVDAFDDLDRQVAALLATNAAAACNRARREKEVREARERIATILDRIEGLVQDTVEVLVEARTREEVERDVCAQLADADPYVSAWLARPDLREETLVAREWAGDAAIDVSDESVPLHGDAPGSVAHATGDSQVVDATALQAADEDAWLRAAHEAGIESVMAIPLDYTDSTYGVLYVCADRSDAFDTREQVVLEALGRAVANTINAIESGRILSANQVIELEFTVDDRDLLFSRLSASTGAVVASAGTVTQDDGSLRIYLTATDADSDEVLSALEDDPAVASVTRVAEHDGESLFDVTVTESLVATLVDHGAVPKGIESDRGIVRYTIELPYETEAREVFGLVEDRYDSTDLVGYHEHERPVRTQQEFRAALADRFTDRQETALQAAFLGGFFDWPREVDGDELADGMDISRPTYHQHLRAAQQKVFEELFDPQR